MSHNDPTKLIFLAARLTLSFGLAVTAAAPPEAKAEEPKGIPLRPAPSMAPLPKIARPIDADPEADKAAPVDAGLPELLKSLSSGAAHERRLADKVRGFISTTVGAYEQVGRRNPAWDDHARKALNWSVRRWLKLPDPAHHADDVVWAASRRALDAGCDDPLLLYIHIRICSQYIGIPPGELGPLLTKVAEALVRSSYPRLRAAHAKVNAAAYLRPAPGDDDKKKLSLENEKLELISYGWNLIENFAKSNPHAASDTADILNSVIQMGLQLDGDAWKQTFDFHHGPMEKAMPDSAIPPLVKGQFLVAYAWHARTAMWAKDVTKEQWRLFAERLNLAEAELAKAWKLGEKDPDAAAPIAKLMITVEMGQGQGRARMEQWFRRSVEADPDDYEAYSAKRLYLEPKWHGKADGSDHFAFGRECLKGGNWRAEIPMILVDAHLQTALAIGDGRISPEYLSRAAVWRDIQSVFGPLLEKYPRNRHRRSQYAYFAALAGQWKEARRQFEALGNKPALGWFEGDPAVFERLQKTANEKGKN